MTEATLLAQGDGRWRALAWLALGDGAWLLVACGVLSAPLWVLPWAPWWLLPWVVPAMVPWLFYGCRLFNLLKPTREEVFEHALTLTPELAPALFEELEHIRERLQGPTLERVVLNGEMNASVHQVSQRWFGSRRVMTLGLPLMALLSPDECRVILVHEYAHLAHSHGRFARWVCLARRRWQRLDEMHQRNRRLVTAPLRLFLSSYVPRMLRETMAFSRRCELRADAQGVRLCGPAVAWRAEHAFAIQSEALATAFWPAVHGRAGTDPIEAVFPYSEMAAHAALKNTPRDEAEAITWAHEFLCRTTSPHDTHPAFGERLALTGLAPFTPGMSLPWRRRGDSAATAWLGASLQTLLPELDAQWQSSQREIWQLQRQRLEDRRREHQDLARRRRSQMFDAEDWYRSALSAREEEGGLTWLSHVLAGRHLDDKHPGLLCLHAEALEQQCQSEQAEATWLSASRVVGEHQRYCHRRLTALYLRQQRQQEADEQRRLADALVLPAAVSDDAPPAPGPHGLDGAEIAKLRVDLKTLFRHARGVWLGRQAGADHWTLLVLAHDPTWLRWIGTLTGEGDTQREACTTVLNRLLPRLHLPLEVCFLGPEDLRKANLLEAERLDTADASHR